MKLFYFLLLATSLFAASIDSLLYDDSNRTSLYNELEEKKITAQ